MPDPVNAIALVALVALLELSPLVRLPLGLVLAIGLLASDAELLPIALIGAMGVMLARLGMALAARGGHDRIGASSPAARQRREALRAHLASSPTYARMTFLMAALPGMPGTFLFPLLGAMRAPLWPALAGTIVGRLPVLAFTTAIFTWLARIGDGSDQDAALTLGVLAVLLLIIRSIGLVDWQHRRETGKWRLNDPDARMVQMTTMFGSDGAGSGAGGAAHRTPHHTDAGEQGVGDDIIEGELVGEEIDGEDADPDMDQDS
ncbi:MAG: VTT domain-containing protein, partial [Chloroflexi bacterium]|nr:VTT domain-containing protein [Chloroflexota bacterium]